jgi:hypothetical protein
MNSFFLLSLSWCRPAITPPIRERTPLAPSLPPKQVVPVDKTPRPHLMTSSPPPRHVPLSSQKLDLASKHLPPTVSHRSESASSTDDLVCYQLMLMISLRNLNRPTIQFVLSFAIRLFLKSVVCRRMLVISMTRMTFWKR